MLEENEKGFIYNGKTYNTSDEAWLAIVTGNITALQGMEVVANDGHTIKYVGDYEIEIAYNEANMTYIATTKDGTVLTSSTKEGLDYAILAWEKVNNKESQENSEITDEPITFAIKKDAEILVNISIDKEGELVKNDKNEQVINDAYASAIDEL